MIVNKDLAYFVAILLTEKDKEMIKNINKKDILHKFVKLRKYKAKQRKKTPFYYIHNN